MQIELRKIQYIEGLKDYVKIFVEGEPSHPLPRKHENNGRYVACEPLYPCIAPSSSSRKDEVIERNRIVFGKEYILILHNTSEIKWISRTETCYV